MSRFRVSNESKQADSSKSHDDYFGTDYMASLDHYAPATQQTSASKVKPEALKPLSKRKIQEVMEEKTVEALSVPISSSNKGFQLLSKLGFTPGENLGKSSTSSGIKEPICVISSMRTGQSGIGYGKRKYSQLKAKVVSKTQRAELHQQLQTGFQRDSVSKYASLRVKEDVHSVQKVMYELDVKKGQEVHSLTKHIHHKYTTMTGSVTEIIGGEGNSKSDVRTEEIGSDDNIETPEFLECCLLYLRSKHCYCFYCGVEYDDENDLISNCPGLSYDDH
ncbi:DUF4187 domain-containing protein [archaeon]|nr:MAG: DUF4187 domain-containing protein [archaeon]